MCGCSPRIAVTRIGCCTTLLYRATDARIEIVNIGFVKALVVAEGLSGECALVVAGLVTVEPV